jgi:molybdopterin molybdotransferase
VVRDTTKPLLLGLLAELGVEATDLGVVRDDTNAIQVAIRRGLQRCEMLLTIGGSSVGGRDFVAAAVGSLAEARVVVRGVRLRPGSTTSAAVVRGQAVFLLPGPPLAAAAGFLTVVEPFLRTHLGPGLPDRTPRYARLSRGVSHALGRTELVLVRTSGVGGTIVASPVDRGGSAWLSSIADADGFLYLHPRRHGYRAGARVEVFPL